MTDCIHADVCKLTHPSDTEHEYCTQCVLHSVSEPSVKIEKALELIFNYSQIDGGHHRAWVIDQVTRLLTGDGYAGFVGRHCCDPETGECYSWDEGIAP